MYVVERVVWQICLSYLG